MNTPIDPTLAADLISLTPAQLAKVAVYARQLRDENDATAPERPGTPGHELLRFAGVLTKDEAAQMMRDIEEGCGQVNHAEW